MKPETVEKLALLYVQANLASGDPPERLLEMYEEAQKAIERKASEGLNEHIANGSWSL